MEQLELGEYRIQFDRKASVTAYESVLIGSPEECGCDPCRNWAQTRSSVIPVALQELLDRLGIPLDREAEVYHNGKLDFGSHSYGGWYHFIGELLNDEGCEKLMLEFGTFLVFFHSHPVMLREQFKGHSVVQLEFNAEIPWLSDVPEEKSASKYLESLHVADAPNLKSEADAVESKWFPDLAEPK